jgi:hypothetical protein
VKKSSKSILWISSIVFTLLIELIFLKDRHNSAISVSYIVFFLVFPLIFILVSILIDIHEKRNKVPPCSSIYLPVMIFVYFLILGTFNFYYYFSGEFLMVLKYIFFPNILLIVFIMLQIMFNKGICQKIFLVAKYVVPVFYGIYWYVIIFAVSGVQ